MNNVKHAVSIIKKDLKKSFLIYIQISLLLLFLYIIISNNITYKNDNEKFNKVWQNKNMFAISIHTDGKPSKQDEDNSIKLKEFIEKNNLKLIPFRGGQIQIKNFNGIEKVKYSNELLKGSPIEKDTENSLIEYVNASEDLINKFNFTLSKGRWFTKNEYKNNSIWTVDKKCFVPVVLGNNFREMFKLGDTLYYKGNELKFKVIGFLNKNQYFSASDLFFYPSKLSSLDNYMIVPYNTPDFYENFKAYDGIWEVPNDKDYSKVLNIVENKIEELKLNANIEEYKTYLDMYTESYKQSKNILFMQQILLSLIVTIGMTLVLILFINKHKKTLMIHRLFGATEITIIKRMCLIPVIISLASLATVISLIKLNFINMFINGNFEILDKTNNLNIKSLTYSIVIMAVIILISIILPVYKIKSESINSIVKGE